MSQGGRQRKGGLGLTHGYSPICFFSKWWGSAAGNSKIKLKLRWTELISNILNIGCGWKNLSKNHSQDIKLSSPKDGEKAHGIHQDMRPSPKSTVGNILEAPCWPWRTGTQRLWAHLMATVRVKKTHPLAKGAHKDAGNWLESLQLVVKWKLPACLSLSLWKEDSPWLM